MYRLANRSLALIAMASQPVRSGFFKDAPQLPPTVIFHLTARFKEDAHPHKLNLGVGAYRSESLKPVVFSAVRKSEAAVVAAGFDKEYLPITGAPAFNVRGAPRLFADRTSAFTMRHLNCPILRHCCCIYATCLQKHHRRRKCLERRPRSNRTHDSPCRRSLPS